MSFWIQNKHKNISKVRLIKFWTLSPFNTNVQKREVFISQTWFGSYADNSRNCKTNFHLCLKTRESWDSRRWWKAHNDIPVAELAGVADLELQGRLVVGTFYSRALSGQVCTKTTEVFLLARHQVPTFWLYSNLG